MRPTRRFCRPGPLTRRPWLSTTPRRKDQQLGAAPKPARRTSDCCWAALFYLLIRRAGGADSSKSVVHDDGRRKGPGPEALEAGVFALRSLEDGSADSRVRAFLASDPVPADKSVLAPVCAFLQRTLRKRRARDNKPSFCIIISVGYQRGTG